MFPNPCFPPSTSTTYWNMASLNLREKWRDHISHPFPSIHSLNKKYNYCRKISQILYNGESLANFYFDFLLSLLHDISIMEKHSFITILRMSHCRRLDSQKRGEFLLLFTTRVRVLLIPFSIISQNKSFTLAMLMMRTITTTTAANPSVIICCIQ